MAELKFVVTGGGTGGHIYPALAIARGLQERFSGSKILYAGTARGLEADLVPRAGFDFVTVESAGFSRGALLRNLVALGRASAGFGEAVKILRRFRPAAVIGTGGYACGPVVAAACFLHIPTLIHEQNAFPGLTNRVLSRYVKVVAVTFEDSIRYFPRRAAVRVTGLPVRREVLTADRDKARREMGIPPDAVLVLSFGGSQGARTLNLAMPDVLAAFKDDRRVRFLHVTGRVGGVGEFERELIKRGIDLADGGNISVKTYLYEMPTALAAADLVISRAGAATIAEITARGLPSILIPYPYAAANHQEYNARSLADRGAAEVILDRELSGPVLAAKVKKLLDDPDRLASMASASRKLGRPQALDDIIRCIEEIMLRQ